MSVDVLKMIQQNLKDIGLYEADIDGKWGSRSQAAFDASINMARLRQEAEVPKDCCAAPAVKKIAWAVKVSDVFIDRVAWIVDALNYQGEDGITDLMSCMAWESNETFRADVRNMAGSGATGLIQFMPATALAFWHTPQQIAAMGKEERDRKGRECCDRLAAMTPEDQLNYVYKYFVPYKGRLQNLGDFYSAILWPAAIGKPDTYVLWDKATRPTTYRQNSGLDVNKDGQITRAETIFKVQEKKTKGLLPAFARARAA